MAQAIGQASQGRAERNVGDHDTALRTLQQAVLSNPGSTAHHVNLGNQYRAMGRFEDARFEHRLAIALEPGSGVARLNLGNAHYDLGQPGMAARAYIQAIACMPGLAEAWVALGAELQAAFRLIDAAGFFRRALQLNPGLAEAHAGLGKTYRLMGEPGQALAHQRRAVELRPTAVENGLMLLNTMMYADSCGNDALFEANRQWAIWAIPPRPGPPAPFATSRDPRRRLRLGYLSADFCDHPVARSLEPLLRHADRSAFEITAYAEDRRVDDVTGRLRSLVDGWRSTVGIPDRNLAAMIRTDRIDILVAVAGHTAHQRMPAMALRPAPIQVSLYDLTTSGIPEIDYWITDRWEHPRHTTERFTERLFRLPMLYLQAPPRDLPEIGPPPSIQRGWIQFASFNNPAKMSPTTIALWARMLGAVRDSRLLLHYLGQFDDPPFRDMMKARFAAHGVAPERVLFGPGNLPRGQHLELYNEVDIALDTYPFNGATTTFEALSMGVPVVSLIGDRFLARMGLSMLAPLGLCDLARTDGAGLVAAAADLSTDLARRTELRRNLRQRLQASPLCDGAGRARQIERAYRAMWRRWCRRD